MKMLWPYAQKAIERKTKGGSNYQNVIQKEICTESLSKSEERPQTSLNKLLCNQSTGRGFRALFRSP